MRRLAGHCTALNPGEQGFSRHPELALWRRTFLFRTKPQSHEDVAPAAKRFSFATASSKGKRDLSAQALFFVASCLRAKINRHRLGRIAPAMEAESSSV
ncbi:hypothetical protein [Sphingopyxis indica]|uniref:hypothetical protein n=1 Tax=Sphingopyxis indica TaxID=436663 RepID=UPI001130BB34|nr:hypothetical protein [Sphingopyxis indica]